MIKNHFLFIYKLKRKSYFLNLFVQVTKASILSMLMLALWQWLHPFQNTPSVALALLVFLISLLWKLPRPPGKMEAKDGLLGLEIKYPQAHFPPLEADVKLKAELHKDLVPKTNPAAEREWESYLVKEKSLIKKMEFARLQMRISSLILPLMLVSTLFSISAPSVETALDQVKGIVRNFTRGSRIEVVSGKFNEGTPGVYNLGKVPHQIALAERAAADWSRRRHIGVPESSAATGAILSTF